jgi:hypothetical protein
MAAPTALLTEIKAFQDLCDKRYRFNNGWDVALTVSGIALGIGIVAAGTYKNSPLGTILGAVVTAVVSAQRAFPFTQRAQFYRSLVGQASNLESNLTYGLITLQDAVKTLESLRLDFAQQLPRGSTSDATKPTQPTTTTTTTATPTGTTTTTTAPGTPAAPATTPKTQAATGTTPT